MINHSNHILISDTYRIYVYNTFVKCILLIIPMGKIDRQVKQFIKYDERYICIYYNAYITSI